MPSTMSDTSAPHLPATRTGRMRALQLMAATPVGCASLVEAAIRPAMLVPCQELFSTVQPENASCGLSTSACVTQSPGSDGSLSRPLPSLAYSTVETKS